MITYSIKLNRPQIEYLLEESFTDDFTRASDQLRRLYGIVKIKEYFFWKNPNAIVFYKFLHLSSEDRQLLEKARENNGWFTKKFSEEDTEVLRYIYEKGEELKEKYGNNWNPRFREFEISKRLNISERSVRKSLDRLVGVLCPLYSSFQKKAWFLPLARMPLVKEILNPSYYDPNQLTFWPIKPHYKRFKAEKSNSKAYKTLLTKAKI